MHRTFAIAVSLALVVARPAAAEHIFEFTTSIDDVQELSCGLASSARGSGTATLNDITGQLTWNFTFGTDGPAYTNGLLQHGSESGAHIHGPAAVGVGGAGVQVGLALGSPKIGSATLSAGQMTDLKAGLYYVNIHSSPGCTGGEIRGQLVYAPQGSALPGALPYALAGLLGLALVAALAARRERVRR